MAPKFTVQFVGYTVSGDHTEFQMKVRNLDSGDEWAMAKRYREFRELHDHLKISTANGDQVPQIPGKRMFGNMDPSFLTQRQRGLEEYLNKVITVVDPQLENEVLRKFLHADRQRGGARAPGLGRAATGGIDTETLDPSQRAIQKILDEARQGTFDLVRSARGAVQLQDKQTAYQALIAKTQVLQHPTDPVLIYSNPYLDPVGPKVADLKDAERAELLTAPSRRAEFTELLAKMHAAVPASVPVDAGEALNCLAKWPNLEE